MSDSVRPQRRQPTRLPRPWDSPGKNTGVGCHFLLQCMQVKSESEVAQSCLTPSDPMDCSLPGSSIHGIFQARVLEWSAIAFSESNPKEYQIVRTHTKETIWIQDLASSNHQEHPAQDTSSKQQTKQKYKRNHQQTGFTTSLSLAHQKKNKQKLSTNLTLYKAYTNHWTNLRRAETKRKKEFNLEAWEKETSNTKS